MENSYYDYDPSDTQLNRAFLDQVRKDNLQQAAEAAVGAAVSLPNKDVAVSK